MKLAEGLCFIMQLYRQKIVIRETYKYFYAEYLHNLFFAIKDYLAMVLYKTPFIKEL